MAPPKYIVKQDAPGTWSIVTSRSAGEASASGIVIVRATAKPDQTSPLHGNLAGTRAWLQLANILLSAQQYQGALAAGQAGLQELGKDYCPDGTCDDTTLKLGAADDLIEEGKWENGVRLVLHMLGERVDLYVRKYREDIVR